MPAPPQRLVFGRVLGAHGVRGLLRVRYLGDSPDGWKDLEEVWLAESEDDPAATRHTVTSLGSTGRAGEVRLGLEGIEQRDEAQALRGRWVVVERAQLEALPEGEYYWHELIGCRVRERGGEEIGVVEDIWETGAHDVLVVRAGDGRRHLVPAAEEFAKRIDPAARLIEVELPPGLLETE